MTIVNPIITIVIPVLNGEKYIGSCLESLLKLAEDGTRHEIIVIDNGSTDRTAEIVKSMNIDFVPNIKGTIGRLRNLGANRGHGNILAFIDSDCTASINWLINALSCMEREKAAMVGCFYKNPDDAGWFAATAELISNNKTGNVVNYIPAGNMIIKKEVFDTLGGFCETIETNEDVDICQRLRNSGYIIFSDPSIEVTHWGVPRSLSEFLKKERWHAKSSFPIFFRDLAKLKNFKVVSYSIAFALIIVNTIIGILLLLFTGHISYLLVTCGLLLLVMFIMAFRGGLTRKKLPSLLLYDLLYGVARGTSFILYIIRTIFPARNISGKN